VAEVLSTGVPPTNVVEVVVNVPVHAVFGIRNGNETDFEVPACIVNGGVVNISVLVLAQFLGPSGPVNVNLTLTVCAAFVQDITVPVNLTVPPREMVEGVIPMAT
jgi:hypothetical protein